MDEGYSRPYPLLHVTSTDSRITEGKSSSWRQDKIHKAREESGMRKIWGKHSCFLLSDSKQALLCPVLEGKRNCGGAWS